MFIKRAKSRPSLRARESELDEPSAASTGSPLGKSSITADQVQNGGSSSAGQQAGNGGDEDPGMGGSVMERKKAQKKDKRLGGAKSSSGGPRLSFGGGGDADEGEAFKPRKSLLSQNIKLPPTPDRGELSSTPSRTTPSYSSDYLAELKASTPSRLARPMTDSADDHGNNEGAEGVNGAASSSLLSRAARNKYATSIQEDTTAGIPDAAAVAAAKMKRQAALENAKHGGLGNGAGGEDYIALGKGQLVVHDGAEGPHPESRLMREEDEGDEGDEDLADYTEAQDRLYLGKDSKTAAARRAKGDIAELIADREADSEDDEETREWEEAQARRAGGYQEELRAKPAKRGYVPTPIPAARTIPSIAPAQARLAAALAEANASKVDAEHALEVAASELSLLEEQERDLKKEVERVEGKREWSEEFSGWVETLGQFLEEKFPLLDAIETDSMSHLTERADMTNARRAKDDADDLALCLGVAQRTEQDTEVDEMGRSRYDLEAGPSSTARRVRREDRGARRSKRRNAGRSAPQGQEDDGFSTDSTLADGDAEDYRAAQRQLEKRVVGLLDDVKAEDFRYPERGLAVRFGDWRRRYEDEYVSAFGGLSMVQAWSFWARGEMVGWEPLRANATSLEKFTWFDSLYAYSHPRAAIPETTDEDEMDLEEDPPLGPDGDLVAQMVSDAVVPLLTKVFDAGGYDVYSAVQTRRAVDLADVVAELTGKDSRKYTTLLKSILAVFHNHLLSLSDMVATCMAPSATPAPAFDPSSRPAMQRFIHRRIKLMRNIMMWRRITPAEATELCGRVVGEVIRPILERHWTGGGQEVAQKVLQASAGTLRPDLILFLQRGPATY